MPQSVTAKTIHIALNASPLNTQHLRVRSETEKEPNRTQEINLKENLLFGLGIEAETVVDTNIPDMCTIEINIIKKSHPIEEKETKNLEKQ